MSCDVLFVNSPLSMGLFIDIDHVTLHPFVITPDESQDRFAASGMLLSKAGNLLALYNSGKLSLISAQYEKSNHRALQMGVEFHFIYRPPSLLSFVVASWCLASPEHSFTLSLASWLRT